MIRYITIIAFWFLLLFGFTACEEGTFEPELFGSISGLVRDADTNEPIIGASVTTNPPTNAIVTNDEGRFLLSEIETGTYSITVRKTGYLNASVSVSVRDGQTAEAIMFLQPKDETKAAGKPVNPQPQHQSRDNPVMLTLSWSVEDAADSVTFDVYFYESSSADEKKIASGITDSSVAVEDLKYSMSYFWQVVAVTKNGDKTHGPIWSFTTRDMPSHPIIFTSRYESNYEIFSTDSVASEKLRLTRNHSRDWSPRFDNRRERIAYVSDRTGQHQIYIMNRDGSNERRVTNLPVAGYHNNGIGISWAPDDGHLIYAHYERLYSINPDGSNLQLIATAPEGRHFREVEYSPDGSRIVALAMASSINTSEIYSMNADGSEMTKIYGDRPGIIESPTFSVNGRHVMFTYDISDHPDPAGRQLSANIHIVSVDGADTVRVSQNKPDGTNDTRPRFSPDGSRIIFENAPNDGSRARDIWIMNADGTNRQRLLVNGEMPDWR